MHYFHYQDDELHCENVPVREIARKVGTPCYMYSCATLQHHFSVFDNAFQGMYGLLEPGMEPFYHVEFGKQEVVSDSEPSLFHGPFCQRNQDIFQKPEIPPAQGPL